MSGGSIYAIDTTQELDAYVKYKHNVISNGSLGAESITKLNSSVSGTIVQATTPNITITGGSISQGNGYDMPTPVNGSSASLYHCFIPKTLNGSDTNGMSITTTVAGKTYSATASNLTSYCANDYYGAIYLPVGSYSIQVGDLTCRPTVTAQTTTDGTNTLFFILR